MNKLFATVAFAGLTATGLTAATAAQAQVAPQKNTCTVYDYSTPSQSISDFSFTLAFNEQTKTAKLEGSFTMGTPGYWPTFASAADYTPLESMDMRLIPPSGNVTQVETKLDIDYDFRIRDTTSFVMINIPDRKKAVFCPVPGRAR